MAAPTDLLEIAGGLAQPYNDACPTLQELRDGLRVASERFAHEVRRVHVFATKLTGQARQQAITDATASLVHEAGSLASIARALGVYQGQLARELIAMRVAKAVSLAHGVLECETDSARMLRQAALACAAADALPALPASDGALLARKALGIAKLAHESAQELEQDASEMAARAQEDGVVAMMHPDDGELTAEQRTAQVRACKGFKAVARALANAVNSLQRTETAWVKHALEEPALQAALPTAAGASTVRAALEPVKSWRGWALAVNEAMLAVEDAVIDVAGAEEASDLSACADMARSALQQLQDAVSQDASVPGQTDQPLRALPDMSELLDVAARLQEALVSLEACANARTAASDAETS